MLCSGSIVYDTLVIPFDESRWGTTQFVDCIGCHVGGNGANTSRALARLEAPVRLIGGIGRDEPGKFVLKELGLDGVDTQAVRVYEEATAATVALVNSQGNRQFLHHLGVSREVFREGLDFTPELCGGMSHYHLASLFILPQVRLRAPEMLRGARAAGLSTSLDTNWDAHGEWMRALEPCLPELDILFMNEDEALRVTGIEDAKSAAAVVLNKGVKTAVMKLSGRGCAIYTAGGEEILCPAFEVIVRDTTGAGDCFVAGFLSVRQREGSLQEAGRFGNAVAALSVGKVGAVSGVLSREQTEAWMRVAQVRNPAAASV